jgi:hypothetical protein
LVETDVQLQAYEGSKTSKMKVLQIILRMLVCILYNFKNVGVYFVEDVVRWTGRGCNTPTEISEHSMGSPETMLPDQCLDFMSRIEM